MPSAPKLGGGEVALDETAFGARFNGPLVHETVRAELNALRQGTASTRTRGQVSGGGAKPWRQKGTGRARAGSTRSPLWKGGGNVHGPQPRDWSYALPKKMRRGALRSALSERLREGNLIVIDSFSLDQPKTKEFVRAMATLGVDGSKALIVDSKDNRNLILAARNVERVKVVESDEVNIYDVLYHEKLLISRAAAERLAQRLDPERSVSQKEA